VFSARLIHAVRHAASSALLIGSASVRSSHFYLAWARAFHSRVCTSSKGVSVEPAVNAYLRKVDALKALVGGFFMSDDRQRR
jgi:hypothetical protein